MTPPAGSTVRAWAGMVKPGKIISGGQTGVDRAALDFAIERGIRHGGWCHFGRRAEDGRIHDRYELIEIETATADYKRRTILNIENSDATMIVYRRDLLLRGKFTGGTLATARWAKGNAHLLGWVFVDDGAKAIEEARAFVDSLARDDAPEIILNIAGPRESKAPGIYAETLSMLREVWP